MGKSNRRELLKKADSVSAIGLIGSLPVGTVEAEDEVNLNKKERGKIDRVLEIVNNKDLSEASKKEKLEKFDDEIIEYALLPHSTTVSREKRVQQNTESGSGLSVEASSVEDEMSTTVTNKNIVGDKLWEFTLVTWWGYTGTDIEYVGWDTLHNTWRGWSHDSTNVTDSTEENYQGGIGTWTVVGIGRFESFINTYQSCEIGHEMTDHGESDRYSDSYAS